MADALTQLRSAQRTILTFGPQALSIQNETLERIRSRLNTHPRYQWIRQVLDDLPRLWYQTVQAIPEIESTAGKTNIGTLVDLLTKSQKENTWSKLPNAILTPIVVIIHLTQYIDYLEVTNQVHEQRQITDIDVKVVGFCTGLLASSAVSSSRNENEFRENGAAAVRLAFCMGAVVDAQRKAEGPSQSLAVSWETSSDEAAITGLVDRFDEAYTSVIFDHNRITVTVTQKHLNQLQSSITDCGDTIKAKPVTLFGRFHTPGHEKSLASLIELCRTEETLRISDGSHIDVLRSILVNRADWFQHIKPVLEESADALIVCFGPERCIPPSISRKLDPMKICQIKDLEKQIDEAQFLSHSKPSPRPGSSENDIAVIGISCKFANADDPDEFWKILCTGESQHQQVPADRFDMNTAFRPESSKKQTWYANLLRDHDSFDHQFFKRSPREAASMDPQQRHMLQVAYQALEQSGYFADAHRESNIGCYVGCCATDYQHNVACHDPTAYTATGNLSSFIAGKISHFFGWTGPALVIDTACSSSAVAIHQACRAILAGDCKQALAGGALVITSPLWFHNLAGASFLSPTGGCKPFSADADGYCRGEGVASVLLKKMSEAIADGDQILGCIAGTEVRQNENCTPIVVPNSQSLSTLFTSVLAQSGLRPEQITLAEAHGTGTSIGDPAEWASLRATLAGPAVPRPENLAVGSVKGHIGHTECTSGVAAIIKVLLMMNAGIIPRQAGHKKLSPKLNSTPEDGMEIVMQTKTWNSKFYAALINNYGASGSNASLIVTQPFQQRFSTADFAIHGDGIRHPYWLAGHKIDDIRRNVTRLLQWTRLQQRTVIPSDLSYNLSKRNNLDMPLGIALTANSVSEVQEKLQKFLDGDVADAVTMSTPPRPVILCFGGQVSTYIGLDRAVFAQFKLLRIHLYACDAIIQEQGLQSIFPHIFERDPIRDQVLLQTTLFAFQYSCAQSWIDSGVRIAAAVGHSFGELTALAVCGVLSVPDAVRVVARRATLIRDKWSSESGAMMAVEASPDAIETLLKASAELAQSEGEVPATIACHNGPTSFTLAGSSKAIEAVSKAALASSTPPRTKKLNVTNAFHSTLVEPLVAELREVTKGINLNKPRVPIFHANDAGPDLIVDQNFVANHLRNPVHFYSALQKLRERYPSAIYLEAGSNSTITNMASRALGSSEKAHFQPINITSNNAHSNIADVTLSLWKAGLRVSYWAHHKSQTFEYGVQMLPPYQFAKTKHWLQLKTLEAPIPAPNTVTIVEDVSVDIFAFTGYQDKEKLHSRFRINTGHEKYETYLSGHIIAETAPICPATLQIDIIIEAVRALHPDLATKDYQPVIRHVENQAPICRDASRSVWLDLRANSSPPRSWAWKVFSSGLGSDICHVTGQMNMLRTDDRDYQLDFKRYERLVSHNRCTQLLEDETPDDMIVGRNIYRAFTDVVDYGEIYRGVQKLVGKGNESAGRVSKDYTGETWFDTVMADCFAQIGGIYVNCMTDRPQSSIYIANGIEQWLRSPELSANAEAKGRQWDVFATHQKVSSKSFCTDIFVFEADTGSLTEVILGIQYVEVSKLAMRKLLLRNSPDGAKSQHSVPVSSASDSITKPLKSEQTPVPSEFVKQKPETQSSNSNTARNKEGLNIALKLKEILAELCGLDIADIKNDAQLGDLGVDSLMAMELVKEIETSFKIQIPEDELGEVIDFPGLVKCTRNHVGSSSPVNSENSEGGQSLASDGDASVSTAISTPSNGELEEEHKPDGQSNSAELTISYETWMDAFEQMNNGIDQGIKDCGFGDYLTGANLEQTKLCVILILEAFEKLGVSLRGMKVGEIVPRVSHVKEHSRLVDYLYHILTVDGGLISKTGNSHHRTDTKLPTSSGAAFLEESQEKLGIHGDATLLAYHTGSHLAEVLQGKETGVHLIFGTEQGRNLVTKLYGEWPLNDMYYHRMVSFFRNLAAHIPRDGSPLRILEMGGGTAGTTKIVLPALAQMGIPVEYTFTDLSPSFVAQARKRFKQYDFVKYRVHDIEKPAPEDLLATQHVVLASNAVHATHHLGESTSHIKQFLRSDGILLMLEMTSPVIFIDIIFGLFEGWWLFNDDREHAVTSQLYWQRVMKSVGYGHCAWTDGNCPEANIERLIMGMSQSPSRYEKAIFSASTSCMPISPNPSVTIIQTHELSADLKTRQTVIEDYVRQYTANWQVPATVSSRKRTISSLSGKTVLVTGTTGSLGSYLVSHLTSLPEVNQVICINRKSRIDPVQRQMEAFESRNIMLGPEQESKLHIIGTDTSLSNLGLSQVDYKSLARKITHICHNAWPMSAARALPGFKSQFQVMRNLIDLATKAALCQESQISFELVSSIAVVGHYPDWTGQRLVPEERVDVRSLIGNGYSDAKFICERMLDETLHRVPSRFRALSVRPGQIAGSKASGAWNTHEHLSFLVKSCQTLQCIPAFTGLLSWTAVEDVAGCCADLLLSEQTPSPFYNADNPVRQPWEPMIQLWTEELGVPPSNVIPFQDWVDRVRSYPGKASENPAIKLIDFLDGNFLRMSCGGLLLDTAKSVADSKTMAMVRPIDDDTVRGYFEYWKKIGWLRR